MNDPIMIEPAGPNRPAFAAWGLAQDPPIQTATASGWLVPVELYPAVPVELLDGAYVDGFLYDRPEPPTVLPRGSETPTEAPEAGPLTVPIRKTPARSTRRSRKAAAE